MAADKSFSSLHSLLPPTKVRCPEAVLTLNRYGYAERVVQDDKFLALLLARVKALLTGCLQDELALQPNARKALDLPDIFVVQIPLPCHSAPGTINSSFKNDLDLRSSTWIGQAMFLLKHTCMSMHWAAHSLG